MFVKPDTPANEWLVIFYALIPPAVVLISDDVDRNNEVQKFAKNCQLSLLRIKTAAGHGKGTLALPTETAGWIFIHDGYVTSPLASCRCSLTLPFSHQADLLLSRLTMTARPMTA